MSEANFTKVFAQNFEVLKAQILEVDKQVNESASTDSVAIFEIYGGILNNICRFLGAENFNFYTKSSPSSPNLSGILSIYENKKKISLQYVKFPVDNKTVAGYAFTARKIVNLLDINIADSQYQGLTPERVVEVDKKLQRITKEVLSIPIINSIDNQTIGIVEITNNIKNEKFSEQIIEALQQITLLIEKSLQKGFFSLLLPTFLSTGKSRQTTVIRAINDENGELSAGDFVGDDDSSENDESEDGEDEDEAEDGEVEEAEGDAESEGEGESEDNPEVSESSKKSEAYVNLIAQLKSTTKPDPEEYPYIPTKEKFYDRFSSLVAKGLIDEAELHQCKLMAETEEKPVEPFLMIHHKIPLLELGMSMAQYYKVPYSPYDPTVKKPESILTSTKVKTEFFQRSKFLPIIFDHKLQSLKIICTDPIALEESGVLKQVFSTQSIRITVTTEIEFQYTFQLFFGESDASKMDELLNKLANQYGTGQSDEFDPDNDESGVSDNEMVVLVNKIISDAYARGVSDIHIEPYPGKAKTRVRYRIDGTLVEVLSLPSTVKDAIATRIKVMANLDISDRRRPQDGKINMKKFSTLGIELRIATIPTSGGLEDVVMRILASGEPLPMEKLGVLPENEAKLIPLIEKPYGILFVCGPTGSGKTTTLHSILKHLNTPETKIWTAEDPVEITQVGLRQVQVNRKAGLDFATVMRSFLRCDPDIIMVGEMRDHETVSIGVEASLTGHLVLSTLHTNSAPEAIVRLLDMGMDPFNFADALLGILAQRLAKSLCKCKEAYTATDEDIELMATEFSQELLKTAEWKKDPDGKRKELIQGWRNRFGVKGVITLYKAKGCGACSNTGYKGRMGLHELMVGTDRIKRMIQQKARVEELLTACLEEGMLTLKMDGMLKVLAGKTNMKQVRTVCIK